MRPTNRMTPPSVPTGSTTPKAAPPPPPPLPGATSNTSATAQATPSSSTSSAPGVAPPPPPLPTNGGVGTAKTQFTPGGPPAHAAFGATPPPPPPGTTPYAKPAGSLFSVKSSSAPAAPAAPVGQPVLRTDQEIAPLVAKGVPRGAIISISNEGMAALKELEANKGDPKSAAYQTLKNETGQKAELMRSVFAQGGPHAKGTDVNNITLAATLNEGFKADAATADSYKAQLARLSPDGFKAFEEMATTNQEDNLKQYPGSRQSVEDIRKLPPEQQVALYKYTQEKYGQYNGKVLFPLSTQANMSGQAIRNNIDGIALTRTALEGLPKHQGTVYRGDDKAHFAAYTPGAVVTRDAFTSTAKNPNAQFGGNCHLEILSKTGRDIQGCSLKPAEEEVLIPPGASFKVLERDDTGATLRLKLQEI